MLGAPPRTRRARRGAPSRPAVVKKLPPVAATPKPIVDVEAIAERPVAAKINLLVVATANRPAPLVAQHVQLVASHNVASHCWTRSEPT